jgi:hypothetical protein
VAELDGLWKVERIGGALPPLHGVSKRIGGDRGETLLAGRLRIPFEVRGRELHYVGPLRGLVDALEPHGPDFRGRTSYRGLHIGRFAMTRAS